MICHASHELVVAIPVFEVWATQSGVFFLQHVVIVRLHALLLDPALDIFVLFTRRNRVVGIVLQVRLKAPLSVAFSWLSNVIVQLSAGAGVYIRPWQRWWWLGLCVCDVFTVLEVGKRVQVLD